MVLQTPRPFAEMTVRENVVLGALFGSTDGRLDEATAYERAEEALGFVRLAERGDDDVGTLNLHEQRFLELARALAGRPQLLLLDEVMAGLNDTELQASIEIVRTARDSLGVTVIWVEHVMKAVLSLAERIVVLNFGRLLADGAPHDVMREPAVVTAYLGERKWGRRRTMLEVTELSAGYLGEDVVHGASFTAARGRGRGGDRLQRRRQDDAVPGDLRAARDRRAAKCASTAPSITGRRAHRIARLGLAYVPAERDLFPQMTVDEHLDLGAYPRRPDAARRALVFDLFPRSGGAAATTGRHDERRGTADARRRPGTDEEAAVVAARRADHGAGADPRGAGLRRPRRPPRTRPDDRRRRATGPPRLEHRRSRLRARERADRR